MESIFKEDYGSIVMEIDNSILQELIKDNANIKILGNTQVEPFIKVLRRNY